MPLLVFPEAFISSVYRPRYAAGGTALAVLALGFAVHNVLSANGSLLTSAGHSRTLAVNSAVGAVANVALNIFLIPKYGVTGAAVATVAAYLLMDLMTAVEMVYYTGSNPLSWTHLGPVLTAVPLYGVTWYLAPAVPGTFLWLVGVTGLFGLVYWTLVLVTVGLSETDVMILRSAQEKYDLEYPLLDRFIRQFS
jgi:O-antigen/teichoic acid export membrane protein